MKRAWIIPIGFVLAVASRAEDGPGLKLAVELASESHHAAAATEFRRLALSAPDLPARGGYLWAAAHEYWRAGDYERADQMLDRAESADPQIGLPAMVLRGENAWSAGQLDEAGFYFESLLSGEAPPADKALAARRLAAVRLKEKDVEGARAILGKAPEPAPGAVQAVDRYARGRDKKPRLGGLLGLVPGAGYFYAGEWANGFRSIILNGLFLFGMAGTAEEEQWGAFAVITFFEFTWYSGSIYGGIDASHRYNRRRLAEAVDGVNGGARFEPDYSVLPALTLKFEF